MIVSDNGRELTSRAARACAFDPVGQALVLIGLVTLTWGIIKGPHAGWGSGLILGLFVTAAVALLAFVLYEQQKNNPLLDLRFFHSVPFSSATVLAVTGFFCFAGFLFLLIEDRPFGRVVLTI